ncbi:hypothetical protein SARC_01625 [Sphaeroforma arctica JP610]|uniref:TLDc domain-containing protein n=1 Tax=Sphaeroforma arctica JP610 TaxID=667725 RepID=A0A0L0GB38_9EUKA|nr:hypothetical protein SARC_01625 [Sphaeroforma arctica JP610]KNC86215.1 hypothetical protein SARC_01625 [Sphaeroforma arctica JP610]|eukprot:XP_014160117.1 hypothetical protein SARC_01625 [Sphaeroforma arctica JP610]
MWDEQKGFFGGCDARSFFIGHRVRMCGLGSNGSNIQPTTTIDTTSLYMAFKGKHHGLGHRQLGALKDFDVLINSDLSSGMHRLGHDGYTITKTEVAIRRIEVWGCAGAAVRSGQAEQKDWERRHRERLIKVKRPGREFWDDNPDKALLEMAGITMSHSERGEMREPIDDQNAG